MQPFAPNHSAGSGSYGTVANPFGDSSPVPVRKLTSSDVGKLGCVFEDARMQDPVGRDECHGQFTTIANHRSNKELNIEDLKQRMKHLTEELEAHQKLLDQHELADIVADKKVLAASPVMSKKSSKSPHGDKKMKEIVPYSEGMKKMIGKIGRDVTDDIQDEHEENAEFVSGKQVEYDRDKNARYTGWVWKGTMHGRGTLQYEYGGNPMRYDGLWRFGSTHGKGRLIHDKGNYACQGEWENDDKETEGMMWYYSSGLIQRYANGQWVIVQQANN